MTMADQSIEHKTVRVNGVNIHYAEKGQGPVILLVDGFPELWYSWRHQINALAALGFRAVAPDLRGYGDSDAPPSVESYTCLHIVGDLIGLLDAVAADQEKVFVVGHDWGAIMTWYLCLFRPERIKALCNLSVPFIPHNPKRNPADGLAYYDADSYFVRFQEPGMIEAEFAELGTETILKEFLTFRATGIIMLPKGKLFGHTPGNPIVLPSWLSDEDVKYYAGKFEKKGFTGGINYYRNMIRNWELLAPWAGAQVKVPSKFFVGDIDLVYHMPGTKEYIHSGGFKRDVPLLEESLCWKELATSASKRSQMTSQSTSMITSRSTCKIFSSGFFQLFPVGYMFLFLTAWLEMFAFMLIVKTCDKKYLVRNSF